ncbi:L-2-amino-thiazoline-4-carboxylic acid hydrolase [Sporomusa aerivorans]|uniref:L-2-amino-thiazoline-4-carboxylic acid hydrolase n=1 Tax=Sporomusa aerivorans TaxID=204936 RepID=UPI00352A0625
MEEELISKAEAANQVRQMGRMMALLYYHMTQQMIAAVGPQQAKKIVGDAIWALGKERGEAHKTKVLAAGYEHIPLNYGKVPDLPALGWDVVKAENAENDTHVKITYCPFAELWQEKDFAEFGRLYCYIDQAKYCGFHPDSDMVTLQNVLEGAACCEMVCRTKKNTIEPER